MWNPFNEGRSRGWLGVVAVVMGCTTHVGDPEVPAGSVTEEPEAVGGPNYGGSNLAGTNLAGTNLAGTNLGGVNLGGTNLAGTNLAGTNLAGTNLAGTNLGGNNLAGTNLAGTNLAGTNLAGTNLAGTNLAGTNLAGTNLAGTNLAGTNVAGNNLAGTNLAGTNLAGTNTGSNIHNLAGPIDGMLYSGEDLWQPKTGQCIVLGIGSTAFAKLLKQQSANAKVSAALGKLPWGFATTSGGPVTLSAWEAVVWGDKTYCTFVLAADPKSTWAGVAGFVKSVFRWNAPSAQAIDISGIEASATSDSTLDTSISTYAGMMDAASHWKAADVADNAFIAGELAFITATTNNESVMVDFSSWVRSKNGGSIVLGNVQSVDPPHYAESVYIAMAKDASTARVLIDRTVNQGVVPGIIDATDDLRLAYDSYRSALSIGSTPLEPVPHRCGGTLYLNSTYGEPLLPGKCDNGISWANSNPGCIGGCASWQIVSGTTAPMNVYMRLNPPGLNYVRCDSSVVDMKSILSETYVHMWGPNFGYAGVGTTDVTEGGTVSATGTPCITADAPGNAFDNLPSRWCVASPTGSIMYSLSAAKIIAGYSVTSADDSPSRDPRDWSFQGCSGGCTVGSEQGWVTLDRRTGEVFKDRFHTRGFAFQNGTAYSQYRLKFTANAGDFSFLQMSEIQMFESAAATSSLVSRGGTVSASQAGQSPEDMTKAFDGSTATKWYVAGVSKPWIQYEFSGSSAKVLTSYQVGSASDTPSRDPRSWVLEGSNDGASWTAVSTQTNQTFASRNLLKSYAVSSSTAYRMYRMRVTANNGSPNFQMGELELFGP